MEGAPPTSTWTGCAASSPLAGVRGVHDLHVWTITSGIESLSAHVVA